MRDSTSFDWNASALATLKTLLAAGSSSREIAEALGVTRNAVIGKCRRIGLNFAAPPGKPRKPPYRRPRKPKPLPFIARRIKPPRKPAGPVHFRNLEQHHCRWIPGEPAANSTVASSVSKARPTATHTPAPPIRDPCKA